MRKIMINYKDHSCPYCGATGSNISLKENERDYYRYKCDICYFYFYYLNGKRVNENLE